MLAKLGSSMKSFRQQHPRYFVASVAAGALLCLVWLAGPSQASFKERYSSYSYPPSSLSPAGQNSPKYATENADASYPAFGPRNLKTAVARAEQLWANNVAKRKVFVQEQGGYSAMRMFSDKAWVGYGQMYTLWDLFLPSFPCPWEVERVGRMGDGGKYTCGLPRLTQSRGDKMIVASFGVERESSWEYEILERNPGAQVYMFDFSVKTYGPQLQEAPASISDRAHFYPYGFGAKDEVIDGHEFYTLKTLMKKFNIDWIDILKVDVEGAEFNILPEVVNDFGDGNLPFGQLLLEIHAEKTKSAYKTEEFADWWEMLEKAGLRAFFSEMNYPAIHWLQFLNNCNGKARCGTLLRE